MSEQQTLTFDAGILARGWLSAFLASGSDTEGVPIICQTLNLEVFGEQGVRFTATDRYMLLTAWVPTLATNSEAAEPSLDESPDLSLTFRDHDGRAKGLLTYLLKLAKRAAKDDLPMPTVELRLGVHADEGNAPSFPGMEREQVALDYPGSESVRCDLVEGNYPDFRAILLSHKPTRADHVVLNPDLLGRIAAIGKLYGSHLRFTHGGTGKMVALAPVVEDMPPILRGGLMPVRMAEDIAADDAA